MRKSFVLGHIYDIVSLRKGRVYSMRGIFLGIEGGCYTFIDSLNNRKKRKFPLSITFLSVIDRTPHIPPTGFNEEDWERLPAIKREKILSRFPYSTKDLCAEQMDQPEQNPAPHNEATSNGKENQVIEDGILSPLLLKISHSGVLDGRKYRVEAFAILRQGKGREKRRHH